MVTGVTRIVAGEDRAFLSTASVDAAERTIH